MAKKKPSKHVTPTFLLESAATPLPPSARPLFLPDLLEEAAALVNMARPQERDQAHAVFKKWIRDLEAGVLDAQTETQVEQDFFKILLRSLGYTTSADVETGAAWNMQTKWSEFGADKADSTLGRFQLDESKKLVGDPLVVVEIKGALKDLDRKDSSGRSPVQQAWDYITNSENVQWAIVSNYKEVRLYNRQRPRRVFHRVMISDLDDPRRFAQFYAVFYSGSLLGTGPISLNAAAILEQTTSRQETVGEKLYTFYDENRLSLIREILGKRTTDLETAIQTAQRLLDRILFIAFAQARHLLSERQLLQKTYDTRIPGLSRWAAFQHLFRAIDEGDEFAGVPRYNGNLFKRDPIIDDPGFKLDPEKWPRVFKEFGEYDYQHEVTVDVLGRIFERSITDIERLKASGLDKYAEALAKKPKVSKRRRLGIYYTSAYIVEYLVSAALDPQREERRRALIEELGSDAVLSDPPAAAYSRAMLSWLDSLRVCDPACGSGAFLTAIYNWIEEHRLDLLTDLQRAEPEAPECQDEKGHPATAHEWQGLSAPRILRNNIFGVDISPESVEIAQLSLWIRTARRGQPLTDLSANVFCGNSVVADQEADPVHAFAWEANIKNPAGSWQFDAVVGNPPYVRGDTISQVSKEYFQRAYEAASGTADLYVYFYELGINILKPGGRLAFISSGTYLKGAFADPLKRFLSTQARLESMIDFGEYQPFPDAEMVKPSCVVFRKGGTNEFARVLKYLRGETPPRDLGKALAVDGATLKAPVNTADWQLEEEGTIALLHKLQQAPKKLRDFCEENIYFGIKTGLNDVFVVDAELRDSWVSKNSAITDLTFPHCQGTHLRRWHQEDSGKWLILIPKGFTRNALGDDVTEADAWNWFRGKYPEIADHLALHEIEARKRQDQGHFWWELRACDYYDKFGMPKIVWPDIANNSRFSIDTGGKYVGDSAFFIAVSDYYLIAVLNSWAIWFVVSKTAPPLRLRSKRWQYRCKRRYMAQLPIPDAPPPERDAIAALAQRACQLAVERYELVEKVCRRFQSSFGSLIAVQLSEKLQDWPSLSFAELGIELKKSFKRERNPWDDPNFVDVWEPYIKQHREEYAQLSHHIAQAEADINQRVFRLFHLDPAAISLLEASVQI